jgi:hypothetical protein
VEIVPCTPVGTAAWSQTTTLDGREFVVRFTWNQRDGHWYVDLADQDDAAIVSGRALTLGVTLLAGVTDARRPAGDLAVLDTTGANDLDPGFADLGARFQLVYFTAADFAP